MRVTLKDFSRLDLRIGKILEAEPHPQADKLYILKVDLGERHIQLVAGIRSTYSQEQLKNKLIVVLVNLEPKTLRGVTSEGMLLAASNKEGPYLLVPEREVPPGTKIR